MSDNALFEDGVVLNASPLIVLLKTDLDFILPKMFERIRVPDAVWGEIRACNDKASRQMKKAAWITRKTVEIQQRILVWNLGAGETEVLSWSVMNASDIAVIDDMAARKCSKALNIRHMGTVGLLVLAYRKGLIDSLEHAFSRVVNSGLYLSKSLMDRLISSENKRIENGEKYSFNKSET